MAIYKRGKTYHYSFIFKGRRYRKSAHTGNATVARQIEAAHRTQLAKGEAGIFEKAPVPTFREFAPRFEAAIETMCQDKPATVTFYKERMRRLLDFAPLASRPLDAIDEELIEALKRRRTQQVSRLGRPLSVASINRELATLRRLLHVAQEWKLIDRLPKIRLFRGEEPREFVLSYQREELYLHMAPQPLRDVAMLMLDAGVRPGEACALEWKHVRLEPAAGAKFGHLAIAGGKTKNAKRTLSLTARVASMLEARRKSARQSRFVFPGDAEGGPFLVSSLDHQHKEFRELLGWPQEFVVHSLRHTMLTRLGESGAEAFTIMRIAGHSSVTVSQRYVHPSPEFLERAFERLDTMNVARRGAASDTKSTTADEATAADRKHKPSSINT